MKKLQLDLDGLSVESFEAGRSTGDGTVQAHDGTCSKQPTCGIASRGEEGYAEVQRTLYACCV
jgi:hypothetical protein